MRGQRRWGALALAAAICVIGGASTAAAQTVIIRNALAGSALELVLNDKSIGSVKADAKGEGALPVNLQLQAGRTEVAVNITIDTCEGSARVLLFERGLQPASPQGQACTRHQVPELFALRPITTLVVDMAPATPAVWLRQGRPPETWLREQTEEEIALSKQRRPSPKGFVLSAGGGFAKINDIVSIACGALETCSGDDFVPAMTGGLAVWATRWLAFEATYTRPTNVTVSHEEAGFFNFDSTFDVHVINLGAKVGVPVGPVRFYGHGGASYHQATFITDQTIEPSTITVDEQVINIPGGTQTFTLRTDGWGYYFGGGIEGWLSNKWALYAEVGRSALKGKTMDEGEGEIDTKATSMVFGVRLRVGG